MTVRSGMNADPSEENAIRFAADHIPALMSYVDTDLRYVFANEAYESWFGFPASTVRGRTMEEVLGEDAFQALFPYAQQALAGATVSFETEVHYRSAGLRVISASYVPDIDVNGETKGFAILAMDVTERRRQEEAHQFLSEASVVLSESLDFETTLRKVAELAARSLADWVIVSLVESENRPRRIALVHREPHMIEWALELEKRYPTDPASESGETQVIRTREPMLYSEVDPALIESAAKDDEHLKLLQQAKISSAMLVPILAGKEALGAITFVSSIPGRYGERELQIAEELCARASLAIQNARLYRKAQEELAERFSISKTLEQTQGRFQLIVNSSLDAVVTIDKESRILYWDGSSQEVFGWTREEVLGKRIVDLIIPPELREAHLRGLAQFLRTGEGKLIGRRVELEAVRKNGTRIPVEISVTAVRHDEDVTFTAFIRDISQLKRDQQIIRESEARYQNLAQELEHRVEERTAELEHANLQLKDANRQLESFSYSVSHDLRAPLRAISSFSQILREDEGARLDEEGLDNLTRIIEASGRMSRLIDDLLQYARLARLQLNAQPVDLTQMCGAIVEELRAKNPESAVEVSIKPGMATVGDSGLLRVALDNLIENAWKFSSKADHPTIEVGSEKLDTEDVYFVKDNGIGFDVKYVHKLFQPFERLHKEADYPGTGIGLVNVEKIITRHGGRIWADAKPGKGATFYFTLPGVPIGPPRAATAQT